MNAIDPQQTDKLLHLTGELASQVLRARVAGRSISRLEAVALADALHLLKDFDIDWPDTLVGILGQYDELCSNEITERPQQKHDERRSIRLPNVNALPRRIFSALGLR